MQTIILRPFDDESIVEVLLVDHNTKKNFEKDYDKALQKAKNAPPEEWQVNDIFHTLEKQGWQILRPSNQITLIY